MNFAKDVHPDFINVLKYKDKELTDLYLVFRDLYSKSFLCTHKIEIDSLVF